MGLIARLKDAFAGRRPSGLFTARGNISAADGCTGGCGARRRICSREELYTLLSARAAALSHAPDWRNSTAELMTLVGLEGSLIERWRLAELLGYDGNLTEIAQLNRWLHRALLDVLAEHGGTLPDHLRPVAPMDWVQ